jgi:small subunit ribosomal protein S3Ae
VILWFCRKNKKLGKKRKGAGRKIVDPFSKKDWFTIRTPSVFPNRNAGFTIATKSQGNKLSRDTLLGRVFTLSHGDLKPKAEEEYFRKFKLRCEEVDAKSREVLTTFYGMDFSTDRLRSLVRKWHSLIEANVDVKTTDGYTLRLFCIGFTRSRPNQGRKTSYAQTAQIKRLRKIMIDKISEEAHTDIPNLVTKLMNESIGREIEKAANGIYPLANVCIRKVKMLKNPKTPVAQILQYHSGSAPVAPVESEVGEAVEAAN